MAPCAPEGYALFIQLMRDGFPWNFVTGALIAKTGDLDLLKQVKLSVSLFFGS